MARTEAFHFRLSNRLLFDFRRFYFSSTSFQRSPILCEGPTNAPRRLWLAISPFLHSISRGIDMPNRSRERCKIDAGKKPMTGTNPSQFLANILTASVIWPAGIWNLGTFTGKSGGSNSHKCQPSRSSSPSSWNLQDRISEAESWPLFSAVEQHSPP